MVAFSRLPPGIVVSRGDSRGSRCPSERRQESPQHNHTERERRQGQSAVDRVTGRICVSRENQRNFISWVSLYCSRHQPINGPADQPRTERTVAITHEQSEQSFWNVRGKANGRRHKADASSPRRHSAAGRDTSTGVPPFTAMSPGVRATRRGAA